MTTQFDRDLTLTETDRPGVFTGEFHDRWYIDRALHGGHVISMLARACEQAVGDPGRAMRSLTVHYVAPAQAGPFEMVTQIDRTGRSLSNVRAQIVQGGSVIASAMAALGGPWESIEWDHTSMPDVPPPEECPDLWEGTGGFTKLHHNFDYRRAMGGAIRSGERKHLTGGWIRLRDYRPVDAALAAGLSDTWVPGPFTMLTERAMFPTIDLSVHFLRPLPLVGDDGSEHCLVWHRLDTSTGGYVIQDTEVWTRSGVLLARGRQHALLIPLRD